MSQPEADRGAGAAAPPSVRDRPASRSSGSRGRPIAVAAGLVAIVAAGLVALQAAAPTWTGLAPATCLPSCYCEAPRAAGILQPANTWSNLGFVVVGGLVVGAGRDRRFGWAAVFLGPASMALHASVTFAGQVIDILSMYLVPTLLVARNLRAPAWAYVAGNLALLGAQVAWPEARRWLFAALVAAVLVTELRARRPRRWLAAAAALLAAAFGCWVLDKTRVWCQPASFIQGHAAWHLICAAAVGAVYLYLQESRHDAVGASRLSQAA